MEVQIVFFLLGGLTVPIRQLLLRFYSHPKASKGKSTVINQFLEVCLHNLINTGSVNFEDWTNPRKPEDWPWITAVLDIYQLIGLDAMSEAYKVIYSYHPPYGGLLSQECKQAFVDQAPESLKSEVSELAEIIEY